MNKTSIGQMRHRVSIFKQERISDGQGGYIETLQKKATVWAHIEPVSGKEFYEAMQVTNEVTHKVRMRYTQISPHDLIIYDNKTFEVVAVIDINTAHKELEVLCYEYV